MRLSVFVVLVGFVLTFALLWRACVLTRSRLGYADMDVGAIIGFSTGRLICLYQTDITRFKDVTVHP